MPAPSIGLLANAAEATFWGPITTAFGLTELNAPNGAPLQVATPNGCTAAAFTDGKGNVVVAFQGTVTSQQKQADAAVMSGGAVTAFADALAFTRSVEQVAAGQGIPSSRIFVTGASLGGSIAESVAAATGLPGASFAGAGLPGYVAPAKPAANFVSFVEHGDAYANWASDAAEHVLVSPGATQDHYGRLVMLGSPARDVLTDRIVADTNALVPAMLTGHLQRAVATLSSDFSASLSAVHDIGNYLRDIAGLAAPSMRADFTAPAPAARPGLPAPAPSPVTIAVQRLENAVHFLLPKPG